MTSDVVSIIQGPTPVVSITQTPVQVISIVSQGPQGPSGGGGGAGYTYAQASPLATWTNTHPIGRLPNVTVYIGGVAVITDVAATTTNFTITFASPQSGYAIFT